jgi:hypothetical protein
MAIDGFGWFDWMIHDPGPSWKRNGGRNGGKGKIPHSAEGFWPYLQELLWKPERRASWGASNLRDGRCFQHYSVWDQTWTSGAAYPNNNFFAFENEGVAGQPLTPAQTNNIIRIGRELIALQHWKPRRPWGPQDTVASLYEHRECGRFGSEPTACPSGRIPWAVIVPALEEGEHMPTPEYVELKGADEDIKKWFAARDKQIEDALAKLAVANAGSFAAIEKRLDALETK